MTGELALYTAQIKQALDGLCRAVDGLDDAQLNWRPPAPDANSIYIIAAHTLGNVEAWVLGIACGQPIERDRPAEFRASGPSAAPLLARARDLASRVEDALTALPPEALDEVRQPSASHWGDSSPRPVTVREALMHVIEHAAGHLGQIDITRDLAVASPRA